MALSRRRMHTEHTRRAGSLVRASSCGPRMHDLAWLHESKRRPPKTFRCLQIPSVCFRDLSRWSCLVTAWCFVDPAWAERGGAGLAAAEPSSATEGAGDAALAPGRSMRKATAPAVDFSHAAGGRVSVKFLLRIPNFSFSIPLVLSLQYNQSAVLTYFSKSKPDTPMSCMNPRRLWISGSTLFHSTVASQLFTHCQPKQQRMTKK